MTTLAAFTREDIADYVSALVFVYLMLIIVNIALSWIQSSGRSRTTSRSARSPAS